MAGDSGLKDARQWLINQITKHADVLVSKKAKESKKKNAQRDLAEIYAAIQAIDVATFVAGAYF